MSHGKEDVISAQVVLRPAQPRRGDAPITAANVADIMPSEEAVKTAKKHFRSLGFTVGEAYANSFPITGKVNDFEKVFGVKLKAARNQGIEVAEKSGKGGLELPLKKLPAELAAVVETVTFSEPPDFGPSNY